MYQKRTIDYFFEFTKSQQFIGLLLIVSTLFSLTLSNTLWGESWLYITHYHTSYFSVEWLVNDVLMAFFFLLAGLEIKRELIAGELRSRKKAMLPIVGAIGGMVVPALLYLLFNAHTATKNGWAIPTATDIAFAVGILNLVGKRVPLSIKIFITALAVVDDLGAVIIIALFYSTNIDIYYGCLVLLAIPTAYFALKNTTKFFYPLFVCVAIIFFCLLQKAHLHTTLAGVLLAAVTPFKSSDSNSFLTKTEHWLNRPVSYIIIPLFAIVNTAVAIEFKNLKDFDTPLFLGIFFGLAVGKPVGITLAALIACKLKATELPFGINFKKLFAAAMLGGIGFTMSIFISLLAFSNKNFTVQAKLAVVFTSLVVCILGLLSLSIFYPKKNN